MKETTKMENEMGNGLTTTKMGVSIKQKNIKMEKYSNTNRNNSTF